MGGLAAMRAPRPGGRPDAVAVGLTLTIPSAATPPGTPSPPSRAWASDTEGHRPPASPPSTTVYLQLTVQPARMPDPRHANPRRTDDHHQRPRRGHTARLAPGNRPRPAPSPATGPHLGPPAGISLTRTPRVESPLRPEWHPPCATGDRPGMAKISQATGGGGFRLQHVRHRRHRGLLIIPLT